MECSVGRVEADPLPEVVHEPLVDLLFNRAHVRVDIVIGYGFGTRELGDNAAELGEREGVGGVLGLWLLLLRRGWL